MKHTVACPRAASDRSAQGAFARRNARPPLARPVNRRIQAGKLAALVKFNLRRPPHSLRSRDTAQSRYHCVYADCRARLHADANAAINIGRKFLDGMDREKSRKKSREKRGA